MAWAAGRPVKDTQQPLLDSPCAAWRFEIRGEPAALHNPGECQSRTARLAAEPWLAAAGAG